MNFSAADGWPAPCIYPQKPPRPAFMMDEAGVWEGLPRVNCDLEHFRSRPQPDGPGAHLAAAGKRPCPTPRLARPRSETAAVVQRTDLAAVRRTLAATAPAQRPATGNLLRR